MAQELQSDSTAETTDPRILRSRRMLMDALAKLLSQKEFDDISIQEIADEATLNRATFYLHYPDKNALLQAMTAARFRDLIARRGLSFTDCDGALRAIALGVCDYLAESARLPRPAGARCRSKAPSFRSSRACSRKALAITRWHPASIPHCWQPRRPGPSSAPRAAGFRRPTAFPLRRWPPRLKRW